VRAVLRLCEFYPGICLTTEEKARINLTLLTVCSMVSPGSFCLLVCSSLLSSAIRYKAFCPHVATNFFCSLVFGPILGGMFNSFAVYVFVVRSVQSVSCCYSQIFHLFCRYSSCVSWFNSPIFTTV